MFLPSTFAQDGLHISRVGSTPITRYQVLGERSSGTNFVKRLLGRNSKLTPSEALGWKHGFVHMMAVPTDMAVICVVRSADTWATSMFSKPWHTTPEMQELAFSDFIRAQWTTIIDRPRYFGGLIQNNSIGVPLQHDRDPLTGMCFENLFALRQSKLTSLLSMMNRECTCIVLRMETAQSQPEITRNAILQGLGFPQPDAAFRPVVKRLGSKFKPAVPQQPEMPKTWAPQDRAFLRSQVNSEQERNLGYIYQ